MSRQARLSDTPFNLEGGVDLDEVAARFQQRDDDIAAAGLDFSDADSEVRNVRRIPRYGQHNA